MHLKFSRLARTGLCTSIAAAIVSMSGCGGGGGSDAPAPANLSVTGVVIDGPIQGATVCLDLNNNAACDAGEPSSSATDAQGNYTISGLTSAQIASAPLIAVIPATALDTGVPVGTAYTLRAPAGKGGVISPVTHLVQIGIAQGMTQAQAEAAVASQLQVLATSLYNNYVGATGSDNTTLAAIVPTIVSALQTGVPLVVETPAASAASYSIRHFEFSDPSNYYLRYFYSSNVPNSAGVYSYYDLRKQVSGGGQIPSSMLYDAYLVATPQGWLPFDGSTANASSGASPYSATWNHGYTYVGTRQDIDVSGMTIAAAIAMVQDLSVNTYSTVNVNTSSLTGTMPAGARVRRYVQTNTATPVAYRVSDGFIGAGVTTLAGMVAAFPVPSAGTVLTTSNTVSMAGLHGTAGCGTTFCPQERLRAAFGSGNAVTYYLCDIDTSTGVQSNCSFAGNGSYSLGTAADGTSPIMSFAGLPPAASIQTFTRVFVERNGHVYYGWKDKQNDSSTTTRLNRVAFEALAAALGITPPTISAAPSIYAGNWSSTYSGSDTGSCSLLVIDAQGALSGACTSTGLGGSFTVSGSVTSTGAASFIAGGGTSSGATFTGSLTGSTGSGSWTQSSSGLSGTWSATKLP